MTELDEEQTPLWHASTRVQALPSEQVVPFVAGGFRQMPVAGSHVPALWHWSEAVHVIGAPGWQEPEIHTSFGVQVLPSLHTVPFATGGLLHVPVAWLQTPGAWH